MTRLKGRRRLEQLAEEIIGKDWLASGESAENATVARDQMFWQVVEFVELLGSVSKPELCELYHAADVVVAPLTRNDRNCDQGCSPLKVLEALAAGTPLIVSDLEVVRELCRDNEEALLVRAGSGKAIKDAMLRLREDGDTGARLSVNGRRHVEQKFGWETAQQALIGLYHEVIEQAVPTTGSS